MKPIFPAVLAVMALLALVSLCTAATAGVTRPVQISAFATGNAAAGRDTTFLIYLISTRRARVGQAVVSATMPAGAALEASNLPVRVVAGRPSWTVRSLQFGQPRVIHFTMRQPTAFATGSGQSCVTFTVRVPGYYSAGRAMWCSAVIPALPGG